MIDEEVSVERERASLAARYRQVRARTEELCAPLAIDDYQVQSVLDTSPPKWHLSHVSWFFETFLLGPLAPAYEPFHPRFAHLFNSYYQQVGTFHPRPERGALSRPTVEEVYRYRAHVDRSMEGLIAGCTEQDWEETARRVVLGLHHEQQHQELLLMDIKRNFFANPLFPAYTAPPPPAGIEPPPLAWLTFAGGLVEIGHREPGFCFDNETPRHKAYLDPYRLGSRLITNAEYLEFVAAGGYSEPRFWLSDGWRAVQEHGWRAPLYWLLFDGAWHEVTLAGCLPLEPSTPVCHVSLYEADAFARWRGVRLPTECEWEVAAGERPIEGNFAESGRFHPRPAAGEGDGQWFGDLWEWTSSAYSAYPGFRPLPGALGEYNAKFMANQCVLRGGCCATPRSHVRATYRNFFYLHDRWPFTGIRLAADGA